MRGGLRKLPIHRRVRSRRNTGGASYRKEETANQEQEQEQDKMSNTSEYKDTWSRYRKQIGNAISKRDEALERIAGYKGERAAREREQIANEFESSVGAAQQEARSSFTRILGDMRGKADEVGEVMQAPTQEQLNLLKMLSLRSSISQAEAESAARALEGNDAALQTLQELCAGRGGVRVAAIHKSQRQKAHDALREFEEGAKSCLAWRGGSRFELLTERSRQGFERLPESERVPLGAALAADVDAERMTIAEFTKTIVGNTATIAGAELLN